MSTVESDHARTGLGLAWAACAVGVLYATVSVYWGLGGTWLVDTVGGSLAKGGRAQSAGVIVAVWAAAVLKLIAAVLPVLALSTVIGEARRRQARILASIAAPATGSARTAS